MPHMAQTDPRPRATIPGTLSVCPDCGAEVVLAITTATERGPGGRAMRLQLRTTTTPTPFAVSWLHASRGRRRVVVRPLGREDSLDRETERYAMPHAAVCQPALVPPTAPDQPLAEVLNMPRHRKPKRGWVRP